MDQNLFDKFLDIKFKQDLSNHERKISFKKVLDEWQEKSSLGSRCINQETTIPAELSEIYNLYFKENDFRPHYIRKGKGMDRIMELNNVLGYPIIPDQSRNYFNLINLGLNPVGVGAAVVAGNGIVQAIVADEEQTRRGFFKKMLYTSIAAAVCGTAGGSGSSYIKRISYINAEQNAVSVQKVIDWSLYKPEIPNQNLGAVRV